MAIKLGDAVVAIAGDRTQLTKDFNAAHRETQSFASKASDVLKNAFSFALGDIVAGGIRSIGSALVGMGKEALDAYAYNERLSMSLDTLVARAAKQVFQTVPKMSAEAAAAIQGVQEKYAESIRDISEKAAERAADVRDRISDQEREYSAQQLERQRELGERMFEMIDQHAERERSIREQISETTSDFTDRQSDLAERRAESAEDRKYRFSERVADLTDRLKEATTDKERERLNTLLNKAAAEYKREETRIAEREKREDERSKKEHDKRLAQLQARLKAEDAEHEKAKDKLKRDYSEQTATVKRHYDAQVQENKEALAKIEADRKKALADAEADLAKSMEKTKGKFSPIELGQVAPFKAAVNKIVPDVKDLLKWITQLAIKSPFRQEEVANAFKMAMAYGFTTDESKRLTQAMIDFASGSGATGATMERISLALGQIRAKGKLAGGEMLQLTEAGLPVGEILAKAFGKSTAEIEDMREKGLIPANEAIEAIVKSLEEDFAGAAEKQANSFSGLISTIEDIKTIGLREFFTGTFQAIQPYLQQFTDFFSSEATMAKIRAWGDEVGKSVGGFLGRLKAAFDKDGIRGVINELGAILKEGWDTLVWPKIQEWSKAFWDWVTGKGGAQEQVPGVMTKLTNSIQAWAGSPETQARLAVLGEALGRGLVNGVEFLVAQTEIWTPILAKLSLALAEALGKVGAQVGGKMAQAMILGFMEELTGQKGIMQSGFSLGLPGMRLGVAGMGNQSGNTNISLVNPQFNGVSNPTDFFALLRQLATGK